MRALHPLSRTRWPATTCIGFYERGRSLEIVTVERPGFDSKFSGNTTDICPVGALTTADFRFEARPWELTTRRPASARTARWAATYPEHSPRSPLDGAT